MRCGRRSSVFTLIFLFTLAPGLARSIYAQGSAEAAGAWRPAVTVTPYAAMGSEMASRVGAALAFAWTRNLSAEIEVGYRPGAMSSSVNLLYDLPAIGRVTPYVAGGIGLEQRESLLTVPWPGNAVQRRVNLTVNAGGGVKVPIAGRVGFRSDARWLNAVGDQPESWRLYNGLTFGVGKRTARR